MSRPHAWRLSCAVAVAVGGAFLAGCGQAPPGADKAAATPLTQQVKPDAQIRAANLFTPTSGWVLTVGRLLTTSDGGTTWEDVTPTRGANAPLETAFFLNPSQAWAVVRSSHVDAAADKAPLDLFTSADGGHHWSVRQTPATIPLDTPGPVHLSFIDSMRGWLIVDQGSHAGFMYYAGFQTTDGGQTWTTASFPQSAPLLFANQFDGFSVNAENGPKSGAYDTHDGGRTWGRLIVPLTKGSSASPIFQLPVFRDDKNGVLAGGVLDASGGVGSEVFYTTSDGGRTWSLASSVANPNPQTSAQLAGVMNGKVWMVAFLAPGPAAGRTYTRLKATHDGGRSWEWLPTVLEGAFSDQMSFSGSTGWAVVSDSGCRGFKTDCFTNIGLIQTDDAGASWRQVHLT
jgi:photosystem II stability/assembly factor-like uncharacterized protein